MFVATMLVYSSMNEKHETMRTMFRKYRKSLAVGLIGKMRPMDGFFPRKQSLLQISVGDSGTDCLYGSR
jgi:hypothetical protein